jgi:hypothetical protein
MTFYTGSDHAVNVPKDNRIDALAEAREQRTRARMSRKAYIDAILESIRDAMEERGNPLADLADMFWDEPCRDRFDLNAALSLHDGRRAGKAITTLVAEASLNAYQDADSKGF